MLELRSVLKSEDVKLTDKDGKSSTYTIRELTALQRQIYNNGYEAQLTIGEDGKPALAGGGLKIPAPADFVKLCFYNSDGTLVDGKFIDDLPDQTVAALQTKAMELSGMDAKALEAAKNALKENDSNGSESPPILEKP